MTAIDAMLQQPAARAIGWALVQFIWQGALIGILTAAVLAALRRSAADIRYVVSTIALSLMLTMPIVTAVQSFSVPSPPRIDGLSAPASPRDDSSALVGDGAPRVARDRDATPFVSAAPLQYADPVERWLPVLVSIWLIGVGMLTLRLLSGWVYVQRMRSHGTLPAAADIDRLATCLIRRLHITRTVRFLESSIVDVPTVIGWLKPVVLLPASALAGLSPRQLEAVLAHELAHIRRHDYLVNLLQTVVETLLFYHPAVWWLSRRIRVERENCCDDLAVSLCGDPVTYAAALAEMEGMRGARGQLVLAASGGSLLQRVRRLLGAPSHAGRAPGWLAAGVAILVIVGISAGALGRDVVVAESTATDRLNPFDGEPVPGPEPPDAPQPPMPPEPPATLMDVSEIADGPAMAEIQHRRGAVSREKATRQCIESIRDGLPIQLRGHAHAFRGACQALANARRAVTVDAHTVAELAHNAVAVTPALVEAAVEPIEQVAAAIAEASKAVSTNVEPILADLVRAVEQAQRVGIASDVNRSRSESRRDGQKSGNYVSSNDGDKLEVNYRGDVEFTDDDTDVRSLTPDGWLRIRDRRRSGSDNTIEFKADGSGNIQRRFWVGSSERPFEPEGRKWLAQMLPRFIRQSGFGAAGRVSRIHRSKGTSGVFAEIALIEGSWGKRVYYGELLKLPSVQPREVQQALVQAGRDIESDFELASLLISADHLVKDDATRKAYFDAARTIDSDFEMRRVFSAALKHGPVTPALLAGMLDASTSIDSDFEAASLLAQIAKLQPIEATTRDAFFRSLASVGSAFERRRVLSTLLQRDDLSSEVLVAALDSAALITSDFERASVLVQFAKSHPIEGPVRASFFKAASAIGSSFERGRVLQTVTKRSDVSNDTVLSVIRSAQTMDSGFERAQVLLTLAGSHELTREARDAYIDASNKLGDFEQGRVLSALAKNERR